MARQSLLTLGMVLCTAAWLGLAIPAAAGPLFPGLNYSAGGFPEGVAVGDLDGDGDLDLAIPSHGDDAVSVLLGHGDGLFASAVLYPAEDNPEAVAMGDLDGDGNLDLVVVSSRSDDVNVLLNNGDGTFPAAVVYLAETNPRSVELGDLDGDIDMVVANSNAAQWGVSVLRNRMFRFCLHDMDGNFYINPFDSNFVLAHFGCQVGGGDPDCDRADIDGNGIVNPFDSNAVRANFGACP